MKPKVYLETTVISYLTARPSRDILTRAMQQCSNDFWEIHRKRYDTYVSDTVIFEAQKGDPSASQERLSLIKNIEQIPVTNEVIDLARTSYLRSNSEEKRK